MPADIDSECVYGEPCAKKFTPAQGRSDSLEVLLERHTSREVRILPYNIHT